MCTRSCATGPPEAIQTRQGGPAENGVREALKSGGWLGAGGVGLSFRIAGTVSGLEGMQRLRYKMERELQTIVGHLMGPWREELGKY